MFQKVLCIIVDEEFYLACRDLAAEGKCPGARSRSTVTDQANGSTDDWKWIERWKWKVHNHSNSENDNESESVWEQDQEAQSRESELDDESERESESVWARSRSAITDQMGSLMTESEN